MIGMPRMTVTMTTAITASARTPDTRMSAHSMPSTVESKSEPSVTRTVFCTPSSRMGMNSTASVRKRFMRLSLPRRAGLSLLTEQVEEEVFVPCCGFDFTAHRDGIGMGAKEIESQSAQDGEVLGGGVLSGALGIFGEDDIKDPVHLVLDGPVGANDMEEFFGWDIFGEEEVSGEGLVCRVPSGPPPGSNSGDGGDPGEGVEAGERAVAHDGGAALLAAIVGGFFEHYRGVSFALAREATFHIGKELSLILLERQHVVAAAVEDRLCEGTAAEKRVRRDDFALEPQHLKDFQSRLGFVPAGRSE